MIFPVSLTGAQAERVLGDMMHNSEGEQIANAVSISPSNVYLLHLPKDIMSRLPYIEFASSPLGEAPDYLSVGAVLELVWNCLVSIGNALVNLVTNLVQAGIAFVCNLYTAVTTVINRIADAFNAFVRWAIEFITATLNAVFGPVVDAIRQVGESYSAMVAVAYSSLVSDVQDTGSIQRAVIIRLLSGKGLTPYRCLVPGRGGLER